MGWSKRAKLVAVDNLPFRPFLSQLACHHLHTHADGYVAHIHVGELGRHHRTIVQVDQGHGVGFLVFVPMGHVVHGGEAVNLTPAAQRLCFDLLSFAAQVSRHRLAPVGAHVGVRTPLVKSRHQSSPAGAHVGVRTPLWCPSSIISHQRRLQGWLGQRCSLSCHACRHHRLHLGHYLLHRLVTMRANLRGGQGHLRTVYAHFAVQAIPLLLGSPQIRNCHMIVFYPQLSSTVWFVACPWDKPTTPTPATRRPCQISSGMAITIAEPHSHLLSSRLRAQFDSFWQESEGCPVNFPGCASRWWRRCRRYFAPCPVGRRALGWHRPSRQLLHQFHDLIDARWPRRDGRGS